MRCQYLRILFLFIATSAVWHSSATACQVPVFRYALERWQPQAYDIVVFHRGALTEAQTTAANLLGKGSPSPNLQLRNVDLDGNVDEETLKLSKMNTTGKLPWVAAQVVGPDRQMRVLWSGPLDSPELRQLADSPLRRTIGRHLVAGESAVWVLVEGGDRARDDAAYQVLQKQLKKLESEVTYPPPVASTGAAQVLTDLPLKLTFSIERLARDDAAEKVFLQMLFFADKGLLETADPIAVPIFGRGRALGCLRGSDIMASAISELGMFLGGQCSCEVKEQNPGYDLLMAVDWELIFREHAAPARPATTQSTAAVVKKTGKPATQPSSRSPESASPEPRMVAAASLPVKDETASAPPNVDASLRHRMLIVGAAVAALLVFVSGWLTFRPRSASNR